MAKELTVSEALKKTGYKRTTVHRWCNQKLVEARKNEQGAWLIDAEDLDRYLKDTEQQRAQFNFSQEAADKGKSKPKSSKVDWDQVDRNIAARLDYIRIVFPGNNYPKGLIKDWILDNMPTGVPRKE